MYIVYSRIKFNLNIPIRLQFYLVKSVKFLKPKELTMKNCMMTRKPIM